MGPTGLSLQELAARAAELEDQRRLEEARDAYDAALRLDSSLQTLAEGRARVSLALKDDQAVEHCRRALAFHDSHPDRQLRMILTAAVELGDRAIPLFEDHIRRHPLDVTAHEMLAELRGEHGAGERFTETYLKVLRDHPTSKPLLISYWNTLTRAGRMNSALESMDAHRQLFVDDRDFAVLETNIAVHAGMTERAASLVSRLDAQPDAQLARAQHFLQVGRPDDAAQLLERVTEAQPDNLSAWAFLEMAWRTTGDDRAHWLVRPGMIASRELALSDGQLAGIAETLRSMHRSRSEPIGQSVRGGTQTAGQLFLQQNPALDLLTEALADAIRDFVGALPGVDPRHPLLKHRDMGIAFGPSWSVRLTGGGFHAAHFHPGGILSSACYISLPQSFADEADRSGWLEIGRPPPQFPDLEPIAVIEPKSGRLVLFPSFMFHGTRPFAEGERLTVAFDLVPVAMD